MRKNAKQYFWRVALFLIGTARLSTVFLIFNFPLQIGILQFSLDAIDSYPAYKGKVSWDFYSNYDKLLDYWWYIFIFIFTFRLSLFPLFLTLFLIRSAGQLLFFITKKEFFFIVFPNVFEIFFLFYIIQKSYFPNWNFLFSGKYLWGVLLFTLVLVLFREYLVHANKTFYNHGKWPRSIKKEEGIMLKIMKFFK